MNNQKKFYFFRDFVRFQELYSINHFIGKSSGQWIYPLAIAIIFEGKIGIGYLTNFPINISYCDSKSITINDA